MGEDGKTGFNKIFSLFMDYFGLGRTASIVGMIVVVLLIMTACFCFFHSAPPKTLIITSGEKGSAYYSVAEKYAKILARDNLHPALSDLLLAGRIDEIESEVHAMKVPASYGDQFYVLRAHINFVRNKLQSLTKGGRNDV
jgi:hypothetical protein